VLFRDPSLVRIRLLFCLLGIAESAIVPFLPLLLRDRGLGVQAIGAVLALNAATGFAAGPLWGYLADRVLGRERTLALCLAATVAGAIALGFAHGVVALSIVGSALWLARSPIMALADALALDRLGAERRDAYGTVRLWMSVTFAVAAIAFGAAIELGGVDVAPFGYAALTAVNAALVVFVFRGRWPRPAPAVASGGGNPLRGAGGTAPTLVLFLVALFLIFAPYTGTYNFVAVRIATLGGGAIFIGLAAGLQAAAEVPSMIAASRFAHRLRPAHIFAAGAGFYLATYAVWSVVTTPAVLASTRVLAGFAFGLTSVGAVVVADELVPERFRATAQASSKAVTAGLAPVAGSLGGGLVYGAFGAPVMFAAAAVSTGLSAAVAWFAEASLAARRRLVEQPQLEQA
jgi:MFS transporter, PPP family, 3-phenylpropionic acid transporter